ncbi:hypothetical protein EIL87_11295 [Saccharopolyspora rhizosphaerae]|uniref:Uncharacterized protein n=1 Tax=Saccharopolyspora rhizosphaerae TaxID=2492662 RepID=A0A3R8P5D0_9PSEU|nr:hypothetical protein [Saccharopolyspora rhizosphaerae]RRO16873.1 hypothetical protein EIL87_11295 [Saccharopolyspora rhizosphaerae]
MTDDVRREADELLHVRGLLALGVEVGETVVGGSDHSDLMTSRDPDLSLKVRTWAWPSTSRSAAGSRNA